jgi:hypothetical protein
VQPRISFVLGDAISDDHMKTSGTDLRNEMGERKEFLEVVGVSVPACVNS